MQKVAFSLEVATYPIYGQWKTCREKKVDFESPKAEIERIGEAKIACMERPGLDTKGIKIHVVHRKSKRLRRQLFKYFTVICCSFIYIFIYLYLKCETQEIQAHNIWTINCYWILWVECVFQCFQIFLLLYKTASI